MYIFTYGQLSSVGYIKEQVYFKGDYKKISHMKCRLSNINIKPSILINIKPSILTIMNHE